MFLPLVLLGYYFISYKRLQLWFLFFSSVFFYAYWSQTFVFLLLFTVVLDFYIAKAIFNTPDPKGRKRLLLTSIIINLSILGFFKYYDFFAVNLNGLIGVAGSDPLFPVLHLILPIGISFYTFQSMSYVIDVYRRTSTAHGGLLEFAGYVTLFPHQISGPLVRHNQIVPQLESAKTYIFHADNFWRGCYFFIFGLSKKMLIADRIAAVVDPLVGNAAVMSNLEAWLAMIGYTLQLYFDFSGYSDMAVGLGLMMNIQFPKNFDSPHKARSITEFWQRWHITLSSWLRDYLYISMGGSRTTTLKSYRNLFITMVVGGFWHGANWTYLVWGALHGSALAVERFFKDRGWDPIKNRSLKLILTFLFVSMALVVFRSPDFVTVKEWLARVFFIEGGGTWQLAYVPNKYKDRFFVALAVAVVTVFFTKNTWQREFKPSFKHAVVLALLFVMSLMYMGDESPFLYFQF